MEFIAGMVVGVVLAGIIGRAKFLQVQNRLRVTKEYLELKVADLNAAINRERDLFDGLTQEFDALAAKTRRTSL